MNASPSQTSEIALGAIPALNRSERRAIRFKKVLDIVPLCPSRIYELINAGAFPAPFKLVEGGRASFFFEDEIYAYLEQRAAASRGAK